MIKGIPITEDFSKLPITRNTAVCFIVEHTGDEKFLEQLADKFLALPCRVFDFYGKYRGYGETTFDRRDIERGYTEENVALTSSYHSLHRLAKGIYVECICCKQDVLVLYDDVSVYHQLLQLTRKLFPWRHRKHIPKVGKQPLLPL